MSDTNPYDWRNFQNAPGFIAEMPHSAAWLLPDQTYRGRTVVWLKTHFDDPADLPTVLRAEFMTEVMRAAEAVRRELRPDRLNYTCFGNAVAHVHFHVIPRFTTDPDWGKAPWRENVATLADNEAKALAGKIAARLEALLTED